MEHIFWLFLSIACIIWYLVITGYVAFRVAFDIKKMLKNLADTQEKNQEQ